MKTSHRITGSILAMVFSTTSALPAAGIPQIKAPPVVQAAPRVITPPKVPTAPKTPVVKVPSVQKIPSAPKVPVVKVPVTPKIPAVRVPTVKVPVTPRIVKTPTAPKIPAVKTPVVKTPTIKTPAVVTQTRITKPPVAVKVPEVTKTPIVRSAIVINKPAPVKTGTSNSDNTIASITSAPPPDTRATVQGGDGSKKSKKEGRDLFDAFRDQAAGDNSKDTAESPYFKNGGFDRDQFRADERLTNAVELEQISGESPDEQDDNTPVSVVRGRFKDIAALKAEAQNVGVSEDDPVFQKVKNGILEGRGIDTSDLQKLKNEVANRGIDLAFGEAPVVSVKDLTRQGDALLKDGKLEEANEKFDQAKDALKNDGKNSAEFRANVIADVQLGKRPISDLDIVVKPNTGGQTGSASGQSSGNPSGSVSGAPERNEPTSQKPAPAITAPGDRVPTDPATGKAADRRPGAGADTAAGGSPAATTPGRDVSAEIDFSDIDFEPDAPTDSSLVPIEPADTFYGPDGAAEPGSPPPSDDDDILSPPPAGNGNGEKGSNGNDDDDDKDDDKNTDTPDTTTETEAPEAAESEDNTAEASEEGTPNPEARDRNGYTGRLADKTGGRLGGDEQRRQNNALDQRKNGNGAGGPNPEGNTSSGVLLTPEEQSAFAKNLGMKRGGGVTTPTGEDNNVAVTERDLKDIAARRGSTINPAGGNGDKGGSGQTLGKKGFAPAGGVPAPVPQGVQAAPAVKAVRAANIQVDTVKVQQKAR